MSVWPFGIGMALVLSGAAWSLRAQPVTVDGSVSVAIEYKSYSASRTKCGFDSFVSTAPPQKYLQKTISEQASEFTYPEVSLPVLEFYWGEATACAGTFTFVNEVTWTPGTSASGTYYKKEPGWPYPLTLGYPSWYGDTSGMGADTSPAYTIPKQHRPVMSAGGPEMQGRAWVIFTPEALGSRTEIYSTDTCTPTGSGDVVLRVGPTNSVNETILVLATDGSWTPATQTHQLSNPYTTGQLKNLVEADLSRCEPDWGQGVSYVSGANPPCTTNVASPYASSALLSDELTFSRQQFKYRFSFPTEKDQNYLASWEERTTFSDSTEPVYTHFERAYLGDGHMMRSEEFTAIPHHASPGATAITRVANLKVEAVPCAPCLGQACSVVGNGSVQLDFDLGRAAFGSWAGKLWIKERKPGLILAKPDALRFAGNPNEVDVVTNGACVIQALSTELLAQTVTHNPFSFSIEFFAITNVGPKLNGRYQTQGSPYRTWTIENPDASTNAFHRLRVMESQLEQSITNEFVWTEATQTWDLFSGNGLRRETKRVEWANNHTLRTETMETREAGGQLIYKELKRYQQFDWGDGLMEEIVDPDGAALTTTYAYDAEGYLVLLTRADGSWERYTWLPHGSHKRLIYKRTPFLNAPPSAPDSSLRVTGFCYAPLCSFDAADDGTEEPFSPRRIGVGLPNTITYNVILSGEKREYRYTGGGDSWSNPDNLLTIIKTFTNGPFQGEVQSIQNPDGTLELYSYATNATGLLRTNIVFSGAPNADGSAITNGTRTTTVLNRAGQALFRATLDIASGLNTDSETVTLDEQGRPIRIAYLDGTFTATVYECCGVSAVTNRDSSVVAYEYDQLKRRVAEHTHLAGGGVLSLLYGYNAAGDVVSIIRVGTDGSQIPIKRCGYDLARRLVAETNALGVITTYAYSVDAEGQSIITTTYAAGTTNSATRVEGRQRDGFLARVTGTAVHPVRYDYVGVEVNFNTAEIRLDSQGNDTSERRFTLVNGVGNVLGETAFVNGATLNTFYSYNNKNQLWQRYAHGTTVTFFTNDTRGQLEYTMLDFNRDDVIDFAGTDRITRFVSDVTTHFGATVLRTRTYVWPSNNVDAAQLLRTVERSVDGQRTWTTAFGQTSSIQMVYAGNGTRFVTNTAPDGTLTVQHYQNGRLISAETLNPQLSTLNSTTYGYDAHGRQTTATDVRSGTTTFAYDDFDRLVSVTTPAPGPGLDPQTTVNHYDELGRIWKTELPDGGSITNEYYLTGELKKTFGARTYPVEYIYDAQGRLRTNITWQNFANNTGAAQTTSTYEPSSGLLTAKRYHDGTGPDYTYNNRGQLAQRTWARGAIAIYDYNYADEISSISYGPPATPNVSYTYDRLGRLASVTQAGATTTLTYNEASQPLSEANSGGPLAGFSVTNDYDALLRRSALSVQSSATPLLQHTFGYDPASRLAEVSDGTHSAGHSYLANAALVENTFFRNGATHVMTTSNRYDNLNRLLNKSSSSSISFNYTYNQANQRTRVDMGGTSSASPSYWLFNYDTLSQLTSGKKYWNDGAPVAGQQFEYAFDDIGNRKFVKTGGDAQAANLRQAEYSDNLLNQYTSRTVPGFVTVVGQANTNATVTVNNQPTLREGEYFRAELAVNNSTGAVCQAVTNVGVLNQGTEPDIVATSTGHVFLAQSPEEFRHDADGNLTNDGRWMLSWDAENRLVDLETRADVPSALRRKVTFTYDYLGRRISKTLSNWNSATLSYELSAQTKFVYDGWNLIAILDGESSILQSFLWGTDLSGTLQGAGGVGGLISMTLHSGPQTGTYFYAYDGNGNVAAVVSAADGSIAAQYEYGPFGELIRATGPLAYINPFRFSTKYQDDESGFLYYGYRYYNASTGRWLNRDPSQEEGGLNLSAFAYNDGINAIDDVGLGVIYTVQANGSKSITFTPPAEPPGFLARLWSGYGNSKANTKECQSKCEELKALLMKAYVAADVYEDRDGGVVRESPNFERLSGEKLLALGINLKEMIDSRSGFYSALYLDHISGKYIVGFRGTQEFKDWRSNFGQGTGLPDAQYNAAATLGTLLSKNPKTHGNISIVGHSLGGGLGTVGALRGGIPAVNFNSAGVSPITAARLGIPLSGLNFNTAGVGPMSSKRLQTQLGGADKLITSYSVPGDILSRAVNRIAVAPGTDGRQVMLSSPGSAPLGINRHLMANVISSIQRDLARNGCK